MADQPAGDKTEKPTPERLRKARQEGQIAQSQEVPSALITSALLILLILVGPGMFRWMAGAVIQSIQASAEEGGLDIGRFLHFQVSEAIHHTAPFLVACGVMSCLAGALVGGLSYSPKALKIDFSRIHPSKGIKNVISLQSLVRLFMAVLKMAVLAVICYLYLRDNMDRIIQLRWVTPAEATMRIGGLLMGLLFRVCAALLVIAGLDFAFQKWNHLKKLRMTRQEVKEERKQYEVSPEVRGRIRQIQYELVRKRMLQDVAKADVVVTNPTHVAVALKYDMKTMDAPVVVAKGPNELAKRIKEIARENQVPILERPVLARALFQSCEIGRMVPSHLFVAVAEVMAMIFRMRKKRGRAVR